MIQGRIEIAAGLAQQEGEDKRHDAENARFSCRPGMLSRDVVGDLNQVGQGLVRTAQIGDERGAGQGDPPQDAEANGGFGDSPGCGLADRRRLPQADCQESGAQSAAGSGRTHGGADSRRPLPNGLWRVTVPGNGQCWPGTANATAGPGTAPAGRCDAGFRTGCSGPAASMMAAGRASIKRIGREGANRPESSRLAANAARNANSRMRPV